MDTTKAFSRRRKLSAMIWITLAVCAGLTVLQVIFSFSALAALIALALGGLAWSERRVCALFANKDPRGGLLGFWNQMILGILAGGYLFWSATTVNDLRVQFTTWGIPDEMAVVAIPLVRNGYLLAGALVFFSQIAIAVYDLRVTRFVREDSPKPA
jgi:hypothetical protein